MALLHAGGRDFRREVFPQDCLCPITLEPMHDPVIAADGNSYERSAIEAWFREGNRRSPFTNDVLPNRSLTPNWALKRVIAQLEEERLTDEERLELRQARSPYVPEANAPEEGLVAAGSSLIAERRTEMDAKLGLRSGVAWFGFGGSSS